MSDGKKLMQETVTVEFGSTNMAAMGTAKFDRAVNKLRTEHADAQVVYLQSSANYLTVLTAIVTYSVDK